MMPFWKVRWFFGLLKHGVSILRGRHNFESSENELKKLALKHNVNWHKFSE